MATVETITRPHDRHPRRRPFTSLMKRLANLKNSSESSSHGVSRSKKGIPTRNNPYPESGSDGSKQQPAAVPASRGHLSFTTPPSGRSWRERDSPTQSGHSLPISTDGSPAPGGTRSVAPTVSTNPGTTHSDAAQSKTTGAGTNASARRAGGEGSTFSSPAPSERSLATTLTTVQSAAPTTLINGSALPTPSSTAPQNTVGLGIGGSTTGGAGGGTGTGSSAQSHLALPSHAGPASAIPPHVMGSTAATPNPSTYTAATANNLLTDNASILTLASSSRRRGGRRNSLDTNASVRALAPSSLFGGSRESLPLSVLSASGAAGAGAVGGEGAVGGLGAVHAGRPSMGGLPAEQRASVYSSSGVAAALSSERSSYYAAKQQGAQDGASVRSGLLGHGRNDSITGSISGAAAGWPTPREPSLSAAAAAKTSRRNSSGWGDVGEAADADAGGKDKGKGKE